MEEKKISLNKTLTPQQVAGFLRLLADELEGKTIPESDKLEWQLHDFNKLKIKLIRQEGGQLSLRLKVKDHSSQSTTTAPTEFTDIAEQEYRPFKQELKATFAELNACAGQGQLPSPELLGRFMKQSQRLIAYPGFGDPYYEEYWQTCQLMEQEAKNGSIPGFQEKMTGIASIKRSCHRRFK